MYLRCHNDVPYNFPQFNFLVLLLVARINVKNDSIDLLLRRYKSEKC